MKELNPGVHLDNMIRQTRNHHVQLSQMADSKANMLMTTASVVLTLCVPYVINPSLKFAAISLMVFCFLTIFLSVYSAMPKIPFLFKHKSIEDLSYPSFNLLFFGDFIHLKYEDYDPVRETIRARRRRIVFRADDAFSPLLDGGTCCAGRVG